MELIEDRACAICPGTKAQARTMCDKCDKLMCAKCATRKHTTLCDGITFFIESLDITFSLMAQAEHLLESVFDCNTINHYELKKKEFLSALNHKDVRSLVTLNREVAGFLDELKNASKKHKDKSMN